MEIMRESTTINQTFMLIYVCNDAAPNAPWARTHTQIEGNEDEDTTLAVSHVTLCRLWAQAGRQLTQSAQRGITF